MSFDETQDLIPGYYDQLKEAMRMVLNSNLGCDLATIKLLMKRNLGRHQKMYSLTKLFFSR
jgi:hypothetical protein